MAYISNEHSFNTLLAATSEYGFVRTLQGQKAYYDNFPDYYSSYMRSDKDTWPRVHIPIVKRIVNESAQFLFGKAPEIKCEEEALQQWLKTMFYDANNGEELLSDIAITGGIFGTVAVRFAFEEMERPDGVAHQFPRLEYYTPLDFEAVYDEYDRRKLTQIYLQLKRKDPAGGYRYMRESWTADERVVYADETVGFLVDSITPAKWAVVERLPNPYGVLPFVVIRNRTCVDDPAVGLEDCFGLYDLVDRLNIACDGWDLFNQVKANPLLFGKMLDGDKAISTRPGEVINAKNENADLKAVTGGESIFDSFKAFVELIERSVYSGADSSKVDASTVTGLSAISGVALRLLYAPLIRLTEQKRLKYGKLGICQLLENVVLVSKQLGRSAVVTVSDGEGMKVTSDALASVSLEDPSTRHIELDYPALFEPTAQDRQADLAALEAAKRLGMAAEDVLRETATILGIQDMDAFIARGMEEIEARKVRADAIAVAAGKAMPPDKGAMPPGGNEK